MIIGKFVTKGDKNDDKNGYRTVLKFRQVTGEKHPSQKNDENNNACKIHFGYSSKATENVLKSDLLYSFIRILAEYSVTQLSIKLARPRFLINSLFHCQF